MSLPLPPNVIDLRGRTFGRLTVREFIGVRNRYAYWSCDCLCGTTGHEVRGKNLLAWEKAGRAISCGCYRKDSTVRLAARLKLTDEERQAAASGKKIRPERPPPKPRPPREKRILPFIGEPRPTPAPPPATPPPATPPPPPAPHVVWAVITKDRHGGYHLAIRLHQHSNTFVMQSRRLDKPSEARREAQRIFGDHLDWMTGDQAGLHTQPWVLEIAEVRILQSD